MPAAQGAPHGKLAVWKSGGLQDTPTMTASPLSARSSPLSARLDDDMDTLMESGALSSPVPPSQPRSQFRWPAPASAEATKDFCNLIFFYYIVLLLMLEMKFYI